MDIRATRERAEQIYAQARAKLNETEGADEARAKEIETEFDRMVAEADSLVARADKAEQVEQRQAALNAADPRRPIGENRAAGETIPLDKPNKVLDTPEYRMGFAKAICGLIDDLTPEERSALAKGKAEFRAQTGGTTTAGGYTVPTTLLAEIEKSMIASGPMYGDLARVITTASGNPLKLPTVDDTSVAAVAHTEATALTDDGGSDVTFGQKSLDAYAFDTEFVRWSWELEADSIFNMESLLAELLGERLARKANSQLTVGTGSSAPNGVVTASSLGVTAAATAAITADELIDLVHSVNPAYRTAPKVAFMMNDSTLKAIRKLKDSDGNYLWQMGNIQQGVPASLLGYRIHVNQDMDSLAAAKKVALFGDFGKYWVRKVGSPVLGVMRERFWPDLGIAGLIRFDGELANTAAIKHLITAAS